MPLVKLNFRDRQSSTSRRDSKLRDLSKIKAELFYQKGTTCDMPLTRLALLVVVLSVALAGFCGAATTKRKTGLMRLGCFVDSAERDLDEFFKKSNYVKPEYCVSLCKERGYRFAGVQATDWCHCGNTFGRHGQVADSECSLACAGDKKQTCGNLLDET
uniref:WSC domain-containing protein n=1 Tax=Macrostomum lignano TaxID=282301 RepID=A0A1I8HCL1_9PLAT